MKRIKYVLCLAALFVFLPIILFMEDKQDTLQAAGFGTTPTFSLGDEVYINGSLYNVVNNGDTMKFLSKDVYATGKTWNDASAYLNQIPATFGTIGSKIFQRSSITLPTENDLSNVKSGNTMIASIPKVSSDWWLGDASVNNRSKFVDATNNFKKVQKINKTVFKNNACGTELQDELGIKPTETKADAAVPGATVITDQVISYHTEARDAKDTKQQTFMMKYYQDEACSVLASGNSGGNGNNQTVRLKDDVLTASGPGPYLAIFALGMENGLEVTAGSQIAVEVSKNECYKVYPSQYANSNTYIPVKSFMITKFGSATNIYSGIIKAYVDSTTIENSVQNNCAGVMQTAGTASVRPILSLPKSIVALGNSSKRSYETSSQISKPAPTSNGTQFLTLQTNLIGISLTSGAEGVSGTTLKTSLNADNTVTIPVTLSGTSEGTSYVSAKAMDKNGSSVYGVLKQVNGTDTVNLDITNLVADPKSASSIQLTLYQENAGSGNTAYISQGTDITINLSKPQEIAFDATNAKTLSYGSDVTLNAKLTSPLSDQANTNITFSILTPNGEAPKATITNQAYTKDTGKAQATLHPLTGTGSVTIAIHKAGEGSAGAAAQQTWEVSLSKKEIDVKPTLPDKIYTIGERMPELTSTSDNLVNGDTIPDALKPKLSPFDEHTEESPATASIIDKVGKWKLLYDSDILTGLTDFTQKYDVTLIDFDNDSQYIFETGIGDVPEGWIEVTPDANAAGWNKETVTIQPSAEAIAAGYTALEIVDDEDKVIKQGERVEYSSSVESVRVKARLKNETSKSNPVTLREIKIDLTVPDSTITVENDNIWVKGTKKVTIIPTDTFSGVDGVTITNDAGDTYTPTNADGVYTFDADKNAVYTITVSDLAGNKKIFTQTIDKIEENEISLTAVPENLDVEEPSKDITVTRDPGSSGIKTFIVYYKESEQDTYEKLADLDTINATFMYTAEMNGIFKFELVNNANQSKAVEVTITNVNPPVPVTRITAVYADDSTQAYVNNSWTKQDIKLTVSNANLQITDQVKWRISEDGKEWSELNGDTKTISTDDILNKTYYFKAYVEKTPLDLEEITAKSFTVKIDKTKPAAPVIKDKENYGTDKWFKEDVQIESSTIAKVNNADIRQDIYVCAGTKDACSDTNATWEKTVDGAKLVSGNGSYEYYFKTIDEAGNESDLSEQVLVNIDNRIPNITISLNQNPIKELINELTFGFFFKENVDITFATDIENADLYYILDSSDHPAPPDDDDDRWKKAESTSLEPDAKAMIYVKAVSKAGVIGRESSLYDVYADQTPPVIDLPADATTWSKEVTLEIPVSDAMSGVKKDSITYSMDGGADTKTALTNGKIAISNLKDGSYSVSVRALDNAGNIATKQALVKIDHTKPSLDTPIAYPAGYAKEHKVTFHTSDSVSGLAAGYPKVNGESIVANEDGSYSFMTSENKTYVIITRDLAGNEHTINFVEDKIDKTPPTIDNKQIAHETELKTHKKVSFDVSDLESGVDSVTVSYVKDGITHTVHVQIPQSGNTYSFTANEATEYTILAKDKAGNEALDSIQVEKIDPTGLKIINVSDTSLWVKDEMRISFEIQAGMSGLKDGYPMVSCPDQSNILLQKHGDVYSFIAKKNSTYTITAQNTSDDEVEEILQLQRIDRYSPTIEDISQNTTANTWREPQNISFHVYDYNDEDGIKPGSGLKNGYPKVFYMEEGVRKELLVVQDTVDPSQYSFLAEHNTIYYVEAMDAVEHDLVTRELPVDHIIDASMLSDIMVVAENEGQQTASDIWVKGDITFTIRGGLDASLLEKYQVAITDGTAPKEEDWSDINQSASHQHKVTGNHNEKYYYFRAYPVFEGAEISMPFIVKLDNVPPSDMAIHVTKKNTNILAQLINAVSFGNWMKEAQSITFTATDNFTAQEELRYQYQEERNGVKGPWIDDPRNLSYDNTDIILYAKAIDLAGNESNPVPQNLSIDTLPPVVQGVQDQKKYKQYYLPRFVSVSDMPANGSGIKAAYYTKDKGEQNTITEEVKIKNMSQAPEVYFVYAEDHAGNSTSLTFTIVPLPDINTEIDGSDESKEIIDQVQKELDEEREHLTPDEIKDYEKWIEDATEKWEKERKKKLEDKETGTIVEGEGDTSFDPNTILVVDEIDENKIPELPRKAIHVYDVYMKKGDTVIQPDGSVKVYLPYNEEEEPIIYVIDGQGNVKEIKGTKENGYVSFITDTLEKYAISNTAQDETKKDVCVVGPDKNLDTKDDVCGSDNSTKNPDGSVDVPAGGKVIFPDKEINAPDGAHINPDGSVDFPDGSHYDPDGNLKPKDEEKNTCTAGPDGKLGTQDDVCGEGNGKDDPKKNEDGSVDVPDGGTIHFPDKEIEAPDGAHINPDGSVVLPDGTEFDKDGNKKPKVCELKDGVTLNVDTDGDGLPDINLDTDDDCIADLNIDFDDDQIPDLDIDADGGGRPTINVDTNGDGRADINLVRMSKWIPEKNVTIHGFTYDTMIGIKPEVNIDSDGDGIADKNIDTDGDGIADKNLDKGDSQNQHTSVGGAYTGDSSKWTIWWILMILTVSTMSIHVYRNKRRKLEE